MGKGESARGWGQPGTGLSRGVGEGGHQFLGVVFKRSAGAGASVVSTAGPSRGVCWAGIATGVQGQ